MDGPSASDRPTYRSRLSFPPKTQPNTAGPQEALNTQLHTSIHFIIRRTHPYILVHVFPQALSTPVNFQPISDLSPTTADTRKEHNRDERKKKKEESISPSIRKAQHTNTPAPYISATPTGMRPDHPHPRHGRSAARGLCNYPPTTSCPRRSAMRPARFPEHGQHFIDPDAGPYLSPHFCLLPSSFTSQVLPNTIPPSHPPRLDVPPQPHYPCKLVT